MNTAEISPASLNSNLSDSAACSTQFSATVHPAVANCSRESLAVNVCLIGAAVLVAVAALAFFAVAVYESLNRHEVQLKSMPYADSEIAQLREQQRENLSDYRWLNKAEGVLAIPIDRAMQLTIERFKAAPKQTDTQPATHSDAR